MVLNGRRTLDKDKGLSIKPLCCGDLSPRRNEGVGKKERSMGRRVKDEDTEDIYCTVHTNDINVTISNLTEMLVLQ